MAKSKPFNTTHETVFGKGITDFKPGVSASKKQTLTKYCQDNFITKRQARRFIKLKWLLATRSGKHIYVQVKCPEKIAEWLETF